MVVENGNFPVNARHLYLQVLRGDLKTVIEIPIFYDIKLPFIPYTLDTMKSPLSELDREDPLKVGSIPKNLLKVLRTTSGKFFEEKDLEYTKVRKAYENQRKSAGKNIIGKISTIGGFVGVGASGLLAGNEMPLEGLFLAVPSVASFIIGGISLLGLVNREVPKELQEFARLNDAAINTDNYLGNIRSKYLHPDLQRDDYLEFF
ncbi:MAG: hypothetical protein AABX96_03840 [Nanoarchaeota archaeon]